MLPGKGEVLDNAETALIFYLYFFPSTDSLCGDTFYSCTIPLRKGLLEMDKQPPLHQIQVKQKNVGERANN